MILAYHEITQGPAPYAYSLSAASFREHVALLASTPFAGIEITFDDGHISQFDTADILDAAGLRGIYFVTVGWTGRKPEYMDWTQLRELARRGHQVHAHGWDHKFLTQCSPAERDIELLQARRVLEDQLGVAVDALSAPGGRWNRRVAEACASAGYRRFYISDPWMQPFDRDGLRVMGRYMIRRTIGGDSLCALLTMSPSQRRLQGLKYRAKEGLRRAIGDGAYQHLWNVISRRPAK